MLSHEQIDHYHEKGYVVPDYRLPEDIVDDMHRELNILIEANPDMTSDAMFVPHLSQANPQGMKATNPEKWQNYACHNDVLDMVSDLIGNHLALWGTTVFGKPAGNGKETPWHQDGQYWPIRPLACCSAWIAIDDVGVENGCMRVIPGSHKGDKLLQHHAANRDNLTLHQELDDDQFDESQAVDILLKPGQISFHDVNIVHGSRRNTSAVRRAGYVLRFMPTTSHFDRKIGQEFERESKVVNFSNRGLILVRGVDRCGLNDYEIGHTAN